MRVGKNDWTLELNKPEKDYQGTVTDNWRPYVFDHIFVHGRNGTQAEVFEETKMFAELAVGGVNTCVLAYGQSEQGRLGQWLE